MVRSTIIVSTVLAEHFSVIVVPERIAHSTRDIVLINDNLPIPTSFILQINLHV